MPHGLTELSIDEIRERFVENGEPVSARVLSRLQRDSRQGVRQLYAVLKKRFERERDERLRMEAMRYFEALLWKSGVRDIAGVDEVGVGPLAGPVVAAAVMFPPQTDIAGVDDSKRLDPATRERLAVEIRAKASGIGIGMASVEEIDRHQHLSCRAARDASRGRGAAAPAAARAGRRAHRARRRRSAEHVQQGRRHQFHDRRRVDHRQDRARPHDGGARPRVSRLWLRDAQGLRHSRTPRGAAAARALGGASDVVSRSCTSCRANTRRCSTSSGAGSKRRARAPRSTRWGWRCTRRRGARRAGMQEAAPADRCGGGSSSAGRTPGRTPSGRGA